MMMTSPPPHSTQLDFNADGIDDLAVSAPSYGWNWAADPFDEAPQFPYVGAVHVYFGGNGTGLSPTPNVTIIGPVNQTNTGAHLNCGDVDGDGAADLLIGSPHALVGGGAITQGGRLDVFLSSSVGWASRVTLDAANYSWAGASMGDWMGYSSAVAEGGGAGVTVVEVEALLLEGEEGGASSAAATACLRGLPPHSSSGDAAPSTTLLLVGSPGYRAQQPGGRGPASVGRVFGYVIPHAGSREAALAACLGARYGIPVSPAPLFTVTADGVLTKGPTITTKLGHGVASGRPFSSSPNGSLVLALGMTGIDFCGSATSLPGE